jgi:hypothetical protein
MSISIPLLLCLLFVAIETKEVGEDFPIRESDQEWLNSLFYLPSEPRVRKEYRMLTEEERTQFNDAFVKMKNDRVKDNVDILLKASTVFIRNFVIINIACYENYS